MSHSSTSWWRLGTGRPRPATGSGCGSSMTSHVRQWKKGCQTRASPTPWGRAREALILPNTGVEASEESPAMYLLVTLGQRPWASVSLSCNEGMPGFRGQFLQLWT